MFVEVLTVTMNFLFRFISQPSKGFRFFRDTSQRVFVFLEMKVCKTCKAHLGFKFRRVPGSLPLTCGCVMVD